jgi:hypothetical protein
MARYLDHGESKPDIIITRMLALAARKKGRGFLDVLRSGCAVFIRGPYDPSFAATSHNDILDNARVQKQVRLLEEFVFCVLKLEWGLRSNIADYSSYMLYICEGLPFTVLIRAQ